ncbi:MAG: hypothetical protein KAH23_08115 [Kiritimatiellae bacterium]|nr:hypothetical protein [Kiritimatiellia bacterium]
MMQTYTIGIPRALFYFYYPGLWEAFFAELGMQVIVSGVTTTKMLEKASLISEAEHCLPLKMMDAHLADIVDKVDMVFVPRILSTLKDHISCPKLAALPDVAITDIAEHVRVLTVDINEDAVPLEKSLMQLGSELGVNKRTVRNAIEKGLTAWESTVEELSFRYNSGHGRGFLILGHPYNLYDDFFSGPVLNKLEAMDVPVKLVQLDRKDVPADPIRWDTCSKMYDALQSISTDDCAGVLQISSFNCGCDSIVMEMFRVVLRKKKIPYMALILDEHSSQAGIDTRLEAFVDSIRW